MAGPAIVFFDGECNLCNGFVRFLLDRDGEGALRFASLQSPYAAQFFRDHEWDPEDLDSIIVFADGEFHVLSDAIAVIASRLSGIWSWGRHSSRLPLAWRNGLYRWVARHRYKIFGRRDQCRIPTKEEAARFLG